MPPRGARDAVSEPADKAAPAAVTAAGPPPDPEGAAKDSADDVAATVEKPPGALGESKGPEPVGAATEAEGAAEANNTGGKADEKAGVVLDQLRDEADSRVKTVTAEPSFASKTLLERFKSSPVLKKGADTFRFEKLLPTALLYAREAHKCSDGISEFVTFSTFAPRPASYEAPDEIEGAVFPFTHLALNTRSYGVAGETKDVVYCTLYESGATFTAVVFDIETSSITEHLMWRVLGAAPLEDVAESVQQVVLRKYIDWHGEKLKGFTSAQDARAARAAAVSAASAASAAAAAAAADAKPAGKVSGKKAGDAADPPPPPPPPPPKPALPLKMSKAEVRARFPSKTSLETRKKTETKDEYHDKIRAGCRAFGSRKPELPLRECREFLLGALGLLVQDEDDEEEEEEEEDAKDAEEPAVPAGKAAAKRSAKAKGAGAAAGEPPAAAQPSPWTRTPCSETGAFYYVHTDGRMQWEVPVDLERPTKTAKPSGPPPPSAFPGYQPPPAPANQPCGIGGTFGGGSGGGGGDGNAMDLMAQLQRNGATVNLTVVQRGAYENSVIYQSHPSQAASNTSTQQAPMSMLGTSSSHVATPLALEFQRSQQAQWPHSQHSQHVQHAQPQSTQPHHLGRPSVGHMQHVDGSRGAPMQYPQHPPSDGSGSGGACFR